MLKRVTATRYVVPLREGGSLPAVLDTDGGGHFVTKFRGAGQGARALIAELIVGGIAAKAGLPVPELAVIELGESFGRSEPDPEIQDILQGSRGVNVGLRYLPGAFNYDPLAVPELDAGLAASIVWLDAFVTNIDRTPRNPNLMFWEEKLWIIDHGAALYFHHNWPSVGEGTVHATFPPIRDHVLLPFAGDIREADARMRERLDDEAIREVIEDVPDELLMDAPTGMAPSFGSAEENRAAYIDLLTRRLRSSSSFVDEAEGARERKRNEIPVERGYRR